MLLQYIIFNMFIFFFNVDVPVLEFTYFYDFKATTTFSNTTFENPQEKYSKASWHVPFLIWEALLTSESVRQTNATRRKHVDLQRRQTQSSSTMMWMK